MTVVRYTVVVIAGAGPQPNLTLLVPFEPSALVSAFVDELYRRVRKHGVQLDPITHVASLRLGSQDGALIDHEDILSDTVEPGEKLFAVFQPKPADTAVKQYVSSNAEETVCGGPDSHFLIRVITPELAKRDRASITPIKIEKSATVKDLHNTVAKHLGLPDTFSTPEIENECNCTLAKKIADGVNSPERFYVVHDKSIVKQFGLPCPGTEIAITDLLKVSFHDIDGKKTSFYGAEMISPGGEDDELLSTYKKPPVVAICSHQRHIPHHARTRYDEKDGRTRRVLDLHTTEMPISVACLDFTLDKIRLDSLIVNGVLEIFAVNRAINSGTSAVSPGAGKSSIFRYRSCWEPLVKQSERGLAKFLSSLRVFASIVQDKDQLRYKDAIYHILDLLTHFSPALRTMHILVEGKTPTAPEAAALSHAVFEVLDAFVPTEIIRGDRSRLFEGARLLFGFILEKARAVKLPEDIVDDDSLPYLSSFTALDLRDNMTMEPVMHATYTSAGLVEQALFEAFEDKGLLAGSYLQSFMVKIDGASLTPRAALLSGGAMADVVVFSASQLAGNYSYADAGQANNVFEVADLTEPHQLAEFCGRNKLTVHKPSQLVSAVAPCLAFDRNGHVAVYTGQLPCSEPGKSSEIFRPLHGQETVEESVLEQLIQPILQGYQADGTAVFDMLGGAAVLSLQDPDELVIFAVDTSASMRQATDFDEVNEDLSPVAEELSAQSMVPPAYYNNTNLDEMKEWLASHESFADMVTIIAGVPDARRRRVATEVLEVLRTILSTDIVEQNKKLESFRARPRYMVSGHLRVAEYQAKLDSLMKQYASLATLEEHLCDFLIFSTTIARDIGSEQWSWSLGEEVPDGTRAPPHHLPSLPASITNIPDGLVCPISHSLMEDAVKATDNVTYSRPAIERWFIIRHRSPMHNLDLDDVSLLPNAPVTTAVNDFIQGNDLLDSISSAAETMTLTFVSRIGRFERTVPRSMSITNLYKLVFRALKARYMVFELVAYDVAVRPSEKAIRTISSQGFKDGCQITIRLADDSSMVVTPSGGATSSVRNEMVLVKVYCKAKEMLCSYWVKRDTSLTLASVLWQYWRAQFAHNHNTHARAMAVWTDMSDSGDDLLTGRIEPADSSLATFLNRQRCFGKLDHEPVWRVIDHDPWTQPLVLKVYISPPPKKRSDYQNPLLSRLDVLKQLFEALINRLIAYSYKTHVGLVTFSSTARVAAPISHVLENLRKAVTNMEPSGDSAIWDSLALCKDQLQAYAARYPNAKKRIIVISDGLDTKSEFNSSEELAWTMQQHNIAVDSISLGDEEQQDLHTLSSILGCYAFAPESLANALALTELEPFLSLTERPTIVPPPGLPHHLREYKIHFRHTRLSVTPTLVDEDNIPPRREHPNLRDDVVELSAAMAHSSRPASSNPRSNSRLTRIMQEINRFVAKGGHQKADVYVSEGDISFFKVVMSGPDESPYSEGAFMLYLHFSDHYPTWAPEARFVTPIKHPNVNTHGRICHALFGRDWTSDISLSTIIDTIFGLLLQAETSDPVNTAATLSYHHDGVEYADEVREFVDRHASKTRLEWKAELLGDVLEA